MAATMQSRRTVLSLYRQLLRSASRFVVPAGRAELPRRIQQGFRANAGLTDAAQIEAAVVVAQHRLVFLQLQETSDLTPQHRFGRSDADVAALVAPLQPDDTWHVSAHDLLSFTAEVPELFEKQRIAAEEDPTDYGILASASAEEQERKATQDWSMLEDLPGGNLYSEPDARRQLVRLQPDNPPGYDPSFVFETLVPPEHEVRESRFVRQAIGREGVLPEVAEREAEITEQIASVEQRLEQMRQQYGDEVKDGDEDGGNTRR